MSRWIKVDAAVNRYITDHLEPESELLQALRRETSAMEGAGMQISHEQARFMALMLGAMGARRCIEIGVYTGYSTLITAEALPADGQIIACDLSREWTDVARRYWQAAGVDGKIALRLAPAAETLGQLLSEGQTGQFDFIFIDADKTGYDGYYEQALKLLRPGGLIMLDNCLWGGAVLDETNREEDTVALRALNRKIATDSRVHSYLAPVGDGIHLAWKR